MKTTILSFLVLLQVTFSIAQNVGINNPSPAASALLDLTSTNKGLLTPRMTTTQRLGIPSPANGLLVYDSSLDQFFYFDGTVWKGIASGSSGWGLTGNAGTSSANFIGTTDASPLRFRVNNIPAGLIDHFAGVLTLGTNAGRVNTAIQNTFIGNGSGSSNTTGGGNTFVGLGTGGTNVTGSQNTLVGHGAGGNNLGSHNSYFGSFTGSGTLNVSTSFNSFFGSSAGAFNNSGSGGSFFGYRAGVSNSTGSGNSFFGKESGTLSSTGSFNTFIGDSAGFTNTTGNSNTVLGYQGNLGSASISNATAVGANARVDASNALVLGSVAGINGAASSVNVGIGTTNPAQRLEVKGQNVPASGSGSSQNGIVRMQPDGSSLTLDFGASGSSPSHSWIQSRDNANYAVNYNLTLNPNGGNVGVGTVNPAERFEVSGKLLLDNGFSADNGAIVYNNNTDYLFIGPRSGTASNGGVIAMFGSTNNAAFNPGGIDFNTTAGTVRILGNGNVGIGAVTTPAEKLHVAGSIRMVDGNQGAGKIMISDANGTASWQSAATAANAWGLTGNAGTVDGTNFIGNTDFVPFNIRVGNQRAGRIEPANNGNTFIGFIAGSASLTASTIFGRGAGSISAGSSHTFIGINAGQNVGGTDNIAIGSFSGGNGLPLPGSHNIFIGQETTDQSQASSSSIAIGHKAQFSGNNSMALGSNAVVFGSNNIVLGSVAGQNGATASVNVGIGTTNPTRRLDVNGNARIGVNGTTLTEVIKATVAGDIPAVAGNTSTTLILPVPNAAPGSSVIVTPETNLSGLFLVNARVSSAGTVLVQVFNVNAAVTIDPPVTNFFITAIR